MGGVGDFFGVFMVDVRGEKRPIFIFVGHSADVKADVESMLSYVGSSYR